MRLGGHDIPEQIIRRRYAKGVVNFFRLYRALADTWGIYDNSREDEPRLIASGVRDESVKVSDEELWRQFCGMAK